jgi:hypothetical protein
MDIVRIRSKTYAVKCIPDIVLGELFQFVQVIAGDCFLHFSLCDNLAFAAGIVCILTFTITGPDFFCTAAWIFNISKLMGGWHPCTTGWMKATEIIFRIVLKQPMLI